MLQSSRVESLPRFVALNDGLSFLVTRISKITVSREAYFVSRFGSDSPRDERRDTSDEFGGRCTNDDQVTLLSLLREVTNVRQHVLHFSVSKLPPPGMHWAEDDPMLDRSQ
jgi:hypothetical protein